MLLFLNYLRGKCKKNLSSLDREKTGQVFGVCEESGVGTGCTTLYRKAWDYDTIDEVEKFFRKLVQRKISENRESPRKYRQIRDATTICALYSFAGGLDPEREGQFYL